LFGAGRARSSSLLRIATGWKCFLMHTDEKLSAFLELESTISAKRKRSSFSNKAAATNPAVWLVGVESLAKMSSRNYKSSFLQTDNCLEKR
jgi:hypothetical protein